MDDPLGTPPELRRQELFFWIFAAAALFFQLGVNALWGPEAQVAETVREMIVNGDYLHPARNGIVNFDKPLLGYWLIVPFAWLLGETCELAARIPAVLSGLAALYATLTLAHRLFDRRTALLAGWLLLGSYGFLFWGRTGTFDMTNMAVTVLAVALFFEVEADAGFREYLVFWLLGFAGALTKGVAALAVPVVLLTPYLLGGGRWKRHANWRNALALALGGTVYFFSFHWPTLTGLKGTLTAAGGSGLQETWQLIVYGNFLRKLSVFQWEDLIDLPRFLLPWSLLIALAVFGMLRNWSKLPERLRLLFWGMLAVLVLLGLFTARRWYCVMPLAPFLAVFGAGALLNDEYGELRWNRLGGEIMRYLAMVAAAFFIASPVAWPLWRRILGITPPPMVLFALPAGGVIAWGMMLFDVRKNNPLIRLSGLPGDLASTVLAGAVLTATLLSCVHPVFTRFRTEKPFFTMLGKRLPALQPAGLFFFRSRVPDSFLYYYNARGPVASGTSLRNVVRDHSGQRVAFFCRNRPEDRREFAAEAARYGIRFDAAAPAFQEPSHIWDGERKNRNYRVYLLEIPESGRKE